MYFHFMKNDVLFYLYPRVIPVNATRQIYVYYNNWYDVNPPYNCSAWSPAASTVAIGQTFTQTNSCTQYQNFRYDYADGQGNILSSRLLHRAIPVNNSQSAVGTKQLVPNAPTNLKSFYACQINELTWNAPSGGVDHYEIWIGSTLHKTVNTTMFSVFNKTGTVRVKACNSHGCGVFSNSAQLSVGDGDMC